MAERSMPTRPAGVSGAPADTCVGSGHAAALDAAGGLSLAAMPTFAIMALLTGVLGGNSPEALCSGTQSAWTPSGMAAMYLLMSLFHSAPWLRLIAAWRNGARH